MSSLIQFCDDVCDSIGVIPCLFSDAAASHKGKKPWRITEWPKVIKESWYFFHI